MSENTKIEWCDHTFNPWTGCTKVSPGCANCYAEGWAKRSGIVEWGKGKPRRRTSVANWKKPEKWNREASADGRGVYYAQHGYHLPEHRPRVFCASLADWLDDEVPIQWLADLVRLICVTPNLDWLLLTKRPQNFRPRMTKVHDECVLEMEAAAIVYGWLGGNPPENVWVGTTVEDQKRANERIPQLLEIPASVRFLSCEPLLEKVDLSAKAPLLCNGIDWVIVGGESGPGHRPFDPDWARSIQADCRTGEVSFFMKQMGGLRKPFPEIPEDLMIREFPKGGRS